MATTKQWKAIQNRAKHEGNGSHFNCVKQEIQGYTYSNSGRRRQAIRSVCGVCDYTTEWQAVFVKENNSGN